MSDKPVIFISYSHKDEPKSPGPNDVCWLTFVQSHLAPAVKHGIYELWADEDIPGGGAWRQEIERKLNECDVCVLLVSRHSLASDFIIDVEIETLRKRREVGQAEIFPIVLTPCAVKTAPWIREINLRPPNGQPLSDFAENVRHTQMAIIADEIATIAADIAQRRSERLDVFKGRARTTDALPREFLDLHQLLHRSPALVEITHLPETAYERLVGRGGELKRLDEAWADNKTNILSLVAEGGAGKSALVNEWLTRLQADNYRGADAVLGWSFYSQGSKERATSAEGFLDWGLNKLGVNVETPSASVKGEKLAEAMGRLRVLLVLDGVEPLQHGPGPQMGQLKDLGLRALLRRFAAIAPEERHGLVILSTRLAVADISRWKYSAAPVIDVEKLSDDAGADLLRDNGVWGTDGDLGAAARDFDGHPLALALLGSFLKEMHFGDVRRRDRVRKLLRDPQHPRHDHAWRVMESYESEWLSDQPTLLSIMHIVGLFDRPASGDCVRALRRTPAISGVTDKIVDLSESDWQRALSRLRDVRLLAPIDPSTPDSIDAHPLVREWFGERLQDASEGAWRAANHRLYEHLRDTTIEGRSPTLRDLAPLYQAVVHGCCAGRYQETLEQIYQKRICRLHSDGSIEFYSLYKLGAVSSNLAAIVWFFERPYEVPVVALSEPDKYWVLADAAFSLRAQGRVAEARQAYAVAVEMMVASKSWQGAAIRSAKISEVELLFGDIEASTVAANSAFEYATRSKDAVQIVARCTNQAEALLAAGRRAQAEALFAEAESYQRVQRPEMPLLFSIRGFRFCDLLIGKGDWTNARKNAEVTITWSLQNNWRLDIARDNLTIARAILGSALALIARRNGDSSILTAAHEADRRFDESLEGLRVANQVQYLARGLLGRAGFRRAIGKWDGAFRDLEEVDDIAETLPMKLYLCDMALERARLAFARIEAFAPLNGMLERDNPEPPKQLSDQEIATLKAEAEKQLRIADDYIQTCGYHRRDEELVELQAVLRGERTFASLPPRV